MLTRQVPVCFCVTRYLKSSSWHAIQSCEFVIISLCFSWNFVFYCRLHGNFGQYILAPPSSIPLVCSSPVISAAKENPQHLTWYKQILVRYKLDVTHHREMLVMNSQAAWRNWLLSHRAIVTLWLEYATRVTNRYENKHFLLFAMSWKGVMDELAILRLTQRQTYSEDTVMLYVRPTDCSCRRCECPSRFSNNEKWNKSQVRSARISHVR